MLESDLKMSKSHANVVSFDENVSYLSTSTNLYERKEHFFERNSYCTDGTNIGTIIIMYNVVI